MDTVGVLGPVQVAGDPNGLAPRDRVVLAALAMRNGHEVSVDTLADALWGDAAPASAHKVVQGCVHRLRGTLGAASIVTGRSGYRLALPADAVDAHEFERLVRRAQELLLLGQGDRAAWTAEEALALWRGPRFPSSSRGSPGAPRRNGSPNCAAPPRRSASRGVC